MTLIKYGFSYRILSKRKTWLNMKISKPKFRVIMSTVVKYEAITKNII